jgi:L-lactate dehydrogenase (cytochrome)
LRSITALPIVLKGVQCAEDAVLAAQHGVAGIILSNHGGRQLDGARSGLEVLAEVMPALAAAGMFGKLEVYIDGGIRRGTDVLKALALGATAVGIGRPVLYGLASYGQAGVERVLDILRDEMEMNMRLVGVRRLSDLTPTHVDARSLGHHATDVPSDHLADAVYEPLNSA